MSNIKGLTRGGDEWEPQFIQEINQSDCIGCGRCYKVCARDVFNLVEKEETDDDDDYYDEDEMMMVMTIDNANDCIGCMACNKVCPKNCQSFAPASL
ncbi:ferredoxin III, nif-specific [Vibrio sp.]|uniref:Ferredoxin III n=1 Tax=Vibrio viridaestus TaxID=2487322 RepID=A0A3N9TDH5_9VIBR|nr:ferredoxin III, nif-specific [Vibrio viridaestus]MDC0610989.1 ferredoxin III, nif-specific [Vibrio sp.]RQW62258.1 ferredoxin III, nif-specific [Vibrio viridaestus]